MKRTFLSLLTILVALPLFGFGAAVAQSPSHKTEQVARLPLAKTLPGPILAIITEVTDGDTVKVEVQTWLNQSLVTAVRINGIDTPELRGQCEQERQKALEAKAFVESLTPVGSTVTLHQVKTGKYANRVVADVFDAQGHLVAASLISAHLARPYGGGRRQPWCS
jgi:endonuclease YncB( thermonuclease family)